MMVLNEKHFRAKNREELLELHNRRVEIEHEVDTKYAECKRLYAELNRQTALMRDDISLGRAKLANLDQVTEWYEGIYPLAVSRNNNWDFLDFVSVSEPTSEHARYAMMMDGEWQFNDGDNEDVCPKRYGRDEESFLSLAREWVAKGIAPANEEV